MAKKSEEKIKLGPVSGVLVISGIGLLIVGMYYKINFVNVLGFLSLVVGALVSAIFKK